MDQVVDGYYPVVTGLGNDIEEIEIEVFSGAPRSPAGSTNCHVKSPTFTAPPDHSHR